MPKPELKNPEEKPRSDWHELIRLNYAVVARNGLVAGLLLGITGSILILLIMLLKFFSQHQLLIYSLQFLPLILSIGGAIIGGPTAAYISKLLNDPVNPRDALKHSVASGAFAGLVNATALYLTTFIFHLAFSLLNMDYTSFYPGVITTEILITAGNIIWILLLTFFSILLALLLGGAGGYAVEYILRRRA